MAKKTGTDRALKEAGAQALATTTAIRRGSDLSARSTDTEAYVSEIQYLEWGSVLC